MQIDRSQDFNNWFFKINMNLWGGLLFTVIGIAMLTIGIFMFINTKNFIQNGTIVKGEVIDYETSTEKNKKTSRSASSEDYIYYPVLKFQTLDGKDMEVTSSNGSSEQNYQIGQNVEIIYDSKNPNNATINSFWSIWFGTILILGLGLGSSIVGICSLLQNRIGIAITVVVTLLLFGGVFFLMLQKDNSSQNSVACKEEAKICPDGSAVGRTGPSCDFAQCPDTTAGWQTYTNIEYGFEFKYPESLFELLPNDYIAPNNLFQIMLNHVELNDYITSWTISINNREYCEASNFCIKKDNLNYEFSVHTELPGDYDYTNFNQMLSTFKFTK